MQTEIKYGKSVHTVNLSNKTDILKHREPKKNISSQHFSQKLKKQLPGKQLKYNKVGIVVADKTRLCDYPIFLPILVNCLEEAGAQKENITFYIAYGTHKRQSDEACRSCYGDIFNEYTFITTIALKLISPN